MIQKIRNMLPGLGIALLVLGVLFGIYLLIWGWSHFLADFWPLDESRVGPNLCASIFLVVLLIAHNEFVVEKRAADRHESHKQALEDAVKEIIHPTEAAESNIADQVEEQFRQDVLDRLDPETDGGLGEIAKRLPPVTTEPSSDHT